MTDFPSHDHICTPGFNLKHVENAPRWLRVICAYQNETRKKILEDILHSVGGQASHGMCPKAFELEMRAIDEEETREMVDDRCQKWRLDDYKTA